jgi:hypothetical protein
MSKQLVPFLRQRSVLLTVTSLEEDQIRVNVLSKKLADGENAEWVRQNFDEADKHHDGRSRQAHEKETSSNLIKNSMMICTGYKCYPHL